MVANGDCCCLISQAIVRLAFELVESIVRSDAYLTLLSEAFFADAVVCLTAFANNRHFKEIALRALDQLSTCAKQLNTRQGGPPPGGFTNSEEHVRLWFPVLNGLALVIAHPHVDVRTAAIERLFGLLLTHGASFNARLMGLVFRGILLPLFDTVRHLGAAGAKDDNEWLTTTCLNAMQHVIEVFSRFFPAALTADLLDDVLVLLASCIVQENESLARIGCTCLVELVITKGLSWSGAQWDTICGVLEFIIRHNLPARLVNADLAADAIAAGSSTPAPSMADVRTTPTPTPAAAAAPTASAAAKALLDDDKELESPHRQVEETMHARLAAAVAEGASEPTREPLAVKLQRTVVAEGAADWKNVRGRCTMQLIVIQSVADIITSHYAHLSNDNLQMLLATLEQAHRFAHAANNKPELKKLAASAGVARLFIRQEVDSGSCFARILLRMYSEDDTVKSALAEARLLALCQSAMGDMLAADSHNPEAQVYLAAKVPVLQLLLKGVADFKPAQYHAHLGRLYPLLVDMMMASSRDLRHTLREVFLRIGNEKDIK